MSSQPNLSVFYLLGGIGFLILAVILFVSRTSHDTISVLTELGFAVAGVLAIVAYFGLRKNGGSATRK